MTSDIRFAIDNADKDVRQTFPLLSGSDAASILSGLARRNIINRDTDSPAQINREQRGKLLSKTAIQKSINNGYTSEDHMDAVANIDALYENAIKIKEDGDKKIAIRLLSSGALPRRS